MKVSSPIDLFAPVEVDRVLEIRTSRMKKMPGVNVMTGIDKKICAEPMKIDKFGLEGDEHDPTFHGGIDKAILGYCASHYLSWQESYPDRLDKFVPGGFGENFVFAHMNERNVCIGDIVAVGSEVLLQVSLPRQPCFKLNHRFSLKNFAPETYKTSRTGWYYRVLREGTVKAGDEAHLMERKWPDWTVERVQEYLHRVTDNLEMNERIAEIEALGEESRGQFRKRVAKAKKKKNQSKKEEELWEDFKVISRKMETPKVVSLMLEAKAKNPDFERFPLGAHARIRLPNGLIRTYSVVSSNGRGPDATRLLEFGIALDENSRGGSRFIHESIQVGGLLSIGRVTSDVAPVGSASHHVFLSGGIGITAFLDLMNAYDSINWSFQLHYAVPSINDAAFRDRLGRYGDRVTIYDKTKGQRMNIKNVVKTLPWNSHLYVCGPNRLMEAVREAVEECGLSPAEVHYEAFAADITGDPFEVEVVNRGGKVLKVGEEESLLEVLKREFGDVASSCEVGNCGTCKVALKSGRADHRGSALMPEEKDTAMLTCVSRGIGRIAIEI
ncbi:Carnitine monooxygenase reductase subunit [Cladobotryum mycophilum]|uniref:Carnitine monooxygenase reductase subunit n=1 Tax=Cladobotryum mycophilum TaxID=491253 RepID=A0ABR0S5R5_9HYPO